MTTWPLLKTCLQSCHFWELVSRLQSAFHLFRQICQPQFNSVLLLADQTVCPSPQYYTEYFSSNATPRYYCWLEHLCQASKTLRSIRYLSERLRQTSMFRYLDNISHFSHLGKLRHSQWSITSNNVLLQDCIQELNHRPLSEPSHGRR